MSDNCCNLDFTIDESLNIPMAISGANYNQPYELPTMSTTLKGGAKVGEGLAIDENEQLSIEDGAITAEKLDNGAVTTDKLADGAVTSDKIERDAFWELTRDLFETPIFSTVFATPYYRSTDSLKGLQGGCIVPGNKALIYTGTMLQLWGFDGTMEDSSTVDLGHGNGMCYNSNENAAYCTSTQDDTRAYYVYKIDPSTLAVTDTINCASKEFPGEPYGIAYLEDSDEYVFVNYWETGATCYIWKTDSSFNVTQTAVIDANVRSSANLGRFFDKIAVMLLSTNHLALFDSETLELEKCIEYNPVCSDAWFITEPEWIDTFEDTVYLGFIPYADPVHTYGGGCKVVCAYSKGMFAINTIKNSTEFVPVSERYYVNSDSVDPLRDGSYARPFNNINEAINSSLRNEQATGDVWVSIQKVDAVYSPSFIMNKAYRIQCADNSITFGAISINAGTNVQINKPVVIDSDVTANLYSLGAANLTVLGTLVFNSTLGFTSNGTIAGSFGGSISCRILNDHPLDLSNYYGSIYGYPASATQVFQQANITGVGNQKRLVGVPIQLSGTTIPEIATSYIARIKLSGTGLSTAPEYMLSVITKQYANYAFTVNDTNISIVINTNGSVVVSGGSASINRIIVCGTA